MSEFRLTTRAEGALADAKVRAVVISTARAIAERTGVKLGRVEADESGVWGEVEGPEVLAVGLAAELRRATEAWYRGRSGGGTLWGLEEGGA